MPQATLSKSTTRTALADAVAGVLGSLVALYAFYPIELIKTNLQAENHTCASDDSAPQRKRVQQYLSVRGLHFKTAHTILSSFSYYFIYSFIFQKWVKMNSNTRKVEGIKPSTVDRLSLSAVAAILNVLFTLPLDGLASRSQVNHTQNDKRENVDITSSDTSKRHTDEHQMEMDLVWDELNERKEIHVKCNNKERPTSSFPVFSTSPLFRIDSLNQPYPGRLVKNLSSMLSLYRQDKSSDFEAFRKLWSGLFPALLLCTNPAIHFTVFDSLKDIILRYKTRNQHQQFQRLNMTEAFLVGIIAKFAATILTYPLIRVKLLLMLTSRKEQLKKVLQQNSKDQYKSELKINRSVDMEASTTFFSTQAIREDGNELENVSRTHENYKMVRVFLDIYKRGGIIGMYKGCGLQLLHTLLKSALAMMIRERITEITHRILVNK